MMVALYTHLMSTICQPLYKFFAYMNTFNPHEVLRKCTWHYQYFTTEEIEAVRVGYLKSSWSY